MTPSTDATLPAEPSAPHSPPPASDLGAELRESLLLLAGAVAVTLGLTTAAQAALTALA